MRAPLLALALVLAVPAAAMLLAGEARAAPGLETPGIVQPHAPIRIDSDADLDAAHGVRGGSGSSSDPYLISSWRIESTGVHVRVGNVSKAVVLRNLDLEGTCNAGPTNCTVEAGIFVTNATGSVSIVHNRVAKMDRAGISVNMSRGVQIVENLVVGGGTVPWVFLPPPAPPSPPGGVGIIVQRCEGAQLVHNEIVGAGNPSSSGSTPAMAVMISDNVAVRGNVIRNSTQFALMFVAVHGAVAEDNELRGNGNGTAFLGFDGLFRFNNVTDNRQVGALVAAATGWLRAEDNNFVRNGGGFEVSGPSNATLRGNRFEENRDFALTVQGDGFADAQENWWGSPDGPNVSGQGPGHGQRILLLSTSVSHVVFNPWLTNAPGDVGAGAQRPGAGVVAVEPPAAGTAAPTAVLEGPRVIPVTTEVVFSAARSTDPEGGPLQALWTFGANDTDAGLLVQRSFNTTGEVAVSLRVTDEQGLSSTARIIVEVVRLPLTVELAAQPLQVGRGQNVTITATAGGQPDGPVTFRFTGRGPGTFEGPGGAATATQWQFDEPGVQFVGVEARAGSEVVTAFERVSVVNRQPSASATVTPRTGPTGSTFTFSAAASSDPDGDDLSYRWEFGGAEASDAAEVARVFQEPGTHVVRLTVSDGFASNTTQLSVEVTATAPPPQDESKGTPGPAPAFAAVAVALAALCARRVRRR